MFRSLKSGFVDGFVLPWSVFVPRRTSAQDYQVTVEQAWRDVGSAMKGSLRVQGVVIDEKRSRQKKQSGRKAA